jgi:DNA-binding response OmpR family regulator
MDSRPRVLSVDNNLANQRLVSQVLEADADVHTASNGSQALRMLESLLPDAILLDIDMPGIDGFQTCRSIRANPKFALTPVIFVSCLTERDEQLGAFQCGGDDFIAKPFDGEILRAKVLVQVQRYRRQKLQLNPGAEPGLFEQLKQVNHYLLAVIKVSSLPRLVDLTLEALSVLGLKAAIYIHKRPDLLVASAAALTDLEVQLLSQTTGAQPQALGGRFVLGSSQAALLVQNMPRASSAEYTRLQDALLLIFEALSHKVQALLVKYAQDEPKAPSQPPTPSLGAEHLKPLESALRGLESACDTALNEALAHLMLLQKQPSISLYERTQLAVMDTKMRHLQQLLSHHCIDVEGRFLQLLAKIPQPDATA